MDISAGAGIYAAIAATQYDDQPIANNGLIIALGSGSERLRFECVSNSSQSGVGEITGRDGAELNTGGIWTVVNPFSRPGVLRVRATGALTAGDQGIYTCTIPDDSGKNIDISVGLYPSGFSGECYLYVAMFIPAAATVGYST